MASRAILRRRKVLLDHLSGQTHSIHGISTLCHASQSRSSVADQPAVATHLYESSSKTIDSSKDDNTNLSIKEQHLGLLTLERPRKECYKTSSIGIYYHRQEIFSSPRNRWIYGSQFIRAASTATAGQTEMDSGDEHKEERTMKQIKEASPEECDQAVEGLSTAKAKAKAKQMQESQKDAISIVKKFWSMPLGIGRALRAVASMSREDWANKLKHWKDEFVSTMQHY